MRKRNSTLEFASERSECLLKNFRESISRQSVISRRRALREAVEAPAPRFWVTEARATRIIAMLLKGEDVTGGMFPEKRRMYMEILRRVREEKERHPEMPLGDIVFGVVNSEAPSSYLSEWSAYKILVTRKKFPKNSAV